MKKVIAMSFGLLALVACSSSPKTVPVVERVQSREGAIDNTDKILMQTQDELGKFSQKLTDLKLESDKTAAMPNKSRFDSTLDQLLLSLQRSAVDLRELQARNAERRMEFEARLNRAMDPAQPSMEDEIDQAE